MRLIFGRSHTLASFAIRAWTWSTWSHVGIIHQNKWVIEATAKRGVILTPLKEFKNRYSEWEIGDMSYSRGRSEQALQYIGCEYDWSAIFGVVFRSGWDNTDKWVCSEIVAKITAIFKEKYLSRVTPEHLYRICSRVESS